MTVTADLSDSGEHILLETEWRHNTQMKTIPGAKWDTNIERWRVPTSWTACLALRTTFTSELILTPALVEWATREKKERIDPCLGLRELTDYSGDPSLFGWQRSGIEFITRGRQVLIADDPGAGKTATTIRGLANLQATGTNVFPILVVGPSSMKKTWQRELDMWWPGLKSIVVKGSAAQRRKQLAEKAHVYIMNFESVRSHSRIAPYGSYALTKCPEHGGEDEKITPAKCQVHKKELNEIPFGAVVVDEAHRIKDGAAIQTRAIKAAAEGAEIRLALTGTPTANDVTDLWSILNFLSPAEFASKTRWIGRYVDTMMNGFGGFEVIGVKSHMRDEFYGSLNPRMRRMPEDVVLNFLPPIIYQRRDCEMSPKQAKAYNEMKEEMKTQLEDGTFLTTGSPLTKMIRLAQFASSYAEAEVTHGFDEDGFPTVDTKVTLIDPSAKLDAFMNDIKDFGSEQVAIMAVSRQLIELLSARLTKAKIPHGLVTGKQNEDERQQAMDDFQSGKTQFILFTTGAGGTGITLTAARYLCRLQVPFSLVDFKQSLRRVRRIGSERHENIIVIDYVTEDTIDGHVFNALQKKEISFEEVVRDKDALQKMLYDEDTEDDEDEAA